MSCENIRDIAQQQGVLITVRGNCMVPHLHCGDQVRLTPRRRYYPGDILAIRASDGRFLCHRMLGVYRRGGRWRWLTQADHAPGPDPAVLGGQVVGRLECPRSLKPLGVDPRLRLRAMLAFARLAGRRLGIRVSGGRLGCGRAGKPTGGRA